MTTESSPERRMARASRAVALCTADDWRSHAQRALAASFL